MSLWQSFWVKICQPLDGFLWHKDISHPIIRPLLRNEILAAAACLLAGGVIYIVFPGLFWFGCGLGCMVWIFWSWARFFLRLNPENYGSVFIRAFFFNFLFRFIILAILLYFALGIFNASVAAILSGFICGAILALISYARYLRQNPG